MIQRRAGQAGYGPAVQTDHLVDERSQISFIRLDRRGGVTRSRPILRSDRAVTPSPVQGWIWPEAMNGRVATGEDNLQAGNQLGALVAEVRSASE